MRYQNQYDTLAVLVRAANRSEDAQSRVVFYLHDNFGHYSWVGIYRLEGQELVLGAWQGKSPTPHPRIAVGNGICGDCAVSCRTEVVPDVGADARYLVCFSETRSEIVVPVVKAGKLWGEINVDSSKPDAFGPDDVEFLEATARLLAERV